jgi:integrase
MTIRNFRSYKSDGLVDSTINTPEQSRCFAVESEGIGDDLDGFLSAITTIAQLWCERATDYADIETLVCDLPIDQWTFAAHDSLAPYSGPYPMAILVRAFIIETLNGWDETALHDYLRANPSLRRDLGFESLPNQSTFWRGWNHRFSEVLCDDVQECVDRIITAARACDVSLPDRIETDGRDAHLEDRDRAFVSLLAYSGVRGAEILRTSADDREGRQGLRWHNVTLPAPTADQESGTLRGFGKAQEWETTPLPRHAVFAVRQYRSLLDEPPGTGRLCRPTAPSKYRVARDKLAATHGLSASEIETVLDEQHIDSILREYTIAPPAVTVNGMRSHMQTLCERAGIDIDGEYLKLHGSRRGLGDTVFRVDRGEAQDLLRHRSLQTTKDAYSHIEAEERAERISDILDSVD